MSDRVYTTVRAWPMPQELPPQLARQLDGVACECVDVGGPVGRVLAIARQEAEGGLGCYATEICLLRHAGLNVFAESHEGRGFPARWEYHPVGGASVVRRIDQRSGDTVLAKRTLPDSLRRDDVLS